MINACHGGHSCLGETGERPEEGNRFREKEGGLCKNPRVEDSTLESRAKKSPKLMEGLLGRAGTSLWGERQRLGLEGQRYWLTGV